MLVTSPKFESPGNMINKLYSDHQKFIYTIKTLIVSGSFSSWLLTGQLSSNWNPTCGFHKHFILWWSASFLGFVAAAVVVCCFFVCFFCSGVRRMIKNCKSGLEVAQNRWGRFNYLSCLWGRWFFFRRQRRKLNKNPL